MGDKTQFKNHGMINSGCPFLPLPRCVKPVSGSVKESIECFDETNSIFSYDVPSLAVGIVQVCLERLQRSHGTCTALDSYCVRRVGRAAPSGAVTRPFS
jgi:hypothetical protein